MPLYRHPDLCVLRVVKDAAGFLKAYTTNTIDAPRSAFLTREGKTVAVVRLAKRSEDEALLVVGKAFVDKLLAHLAKYLALSETKIVPAGEYTVYFDTEEGDDAVVIPEKSGRWILSLDPLKDASMNAEEFTRFRVEHGIPEQGTDFTDEMPLCVDPSLIHFEKGCYLGQEIVARVHYRGSPPKRLLVKTQNECSPEEFARMTSSVELNGQATGFVFVSP